MDHEQRQKVIDSEYWLNPPYDNVESHDVYVDQDGEEFDTLLDWIKTLDNSELIDFIVDEGLEDKIAYMWDVKYKD